MGGAWPSPWRRESAWAALGNAVIGSPVAVTGASGRLGRAVLDALRERGADARPWTRPEYDLDDPAAAEALVARDRPALVIHCAAWTDVDGCARDPNLALRRNGAATAELAAACAGRGTNLVYVSTNEVFDGRRTDGVGYKEDDPTAPINPYGVSKLGGERLAASAYAAPSVSARLWIVRTAWLFGPPGNDFPGKIIAAADRLEPGKALRVVNDEIGSPTYSVDLATALIDLVVSAPEGIHHLASGRATRFEFAGEVLARCRPQVRLEPISRREFQRASEPPQWSVLDSGRAQSFGIRLRPWVNALNEYLAQACMPPL